MRTPKPLGLISIIANSINDYILENPGMEPVEAYNGWVQSVAIPRYFPMDRHDIALMALELFDTFINRCDKESLEACRDIEASAALRMRKVS